jgi:hypothetical protein
VLPNHNARLVTRGDPRLIGVFMGGLAFELRAGLSLAEFWRDQGKPAEARDLPMSFTSSR